jgi:hypothetical protein
MLVHMAPEEVKGLQSLALAAGGSLSINPDTGLYEANFLKKLLPTLLGFGLNFLFPGLGALGSGLLVGAGETIRTGGDLGKGLMAGLGAFGGAGLGSALAGAGAVAGGAGQAGITAAGETAAAAAAKEGAQQAAIEAAKKKAIEEATRKAVAEQAATKGIASGATGWQNIKAGAGSLFKTSPGIGALGGADAFGATFNALPGGMIGKAGLVTSAANVLTPDMEVPGDGYNIDDSYYESYGYDPAQGRFLGGQWRKGYPGFPGYAMGGPVMPRANFDYPQAGITKSNYAPNLEYSKPREILDGYDTKIDPFTGAEGFAKGGSVPSGVQELNNAMVSARYSRGQGFLESVAPNPMNSLQAAKDLPTRIQALQRMADTGPSPYEPGNYGYTQSESGYGNDPFRMGPSGFIQAGHKAEASDRAGAMALGNQYQAYLNRMVNPFATGDSGIVRDERLGDESLNMGFADGGSVQQPTNVVDRVASVGTFDPTGPATPSQMEQYYQGLLTPPQQTAADPKFAEYLQNLNKFVTSPVAPPPPPPQPPQTPPAKPPGDPRVTGTGGTGTGMVYDPTTGKFVPGTGSPGDTGMDLAELQNLVNSGMFSGFNFGDLGNYLQNGGYGDTTGLTYDPATGSFRQPGSQTVDTAPTAATGTYSNTPSKSMELMRKSMMGEPLTDEDKAWMAQTDAENERNFKAQFQNTLSPVTDMFGLGGPGSPVAPLNYGDMTPISTAPNQGQMQGMDPNAFHLAQMGDMGGYANQFQGFQPQPTDFGSMGNYGLGALGSTYSAPSFAMPSFDFASQTPAVPTTSYSAPMTTGAGSTGASAPQFGFGNSDVMYGNSSLGGGEPNVFGFAGGGTIQKAAAGKLVTGDGDGMSDDIRANISGNQEARLADGEFVIPADVVSHLGNGSTDAGADRLYSMMDRIRKARTGRTRQAPEVDADKYLPA